MQLDSKRLYDIMSPSARAYCNQLKAKSALRIRNVDASGQSYAKSNCNPKAGFLESTHISSSEGTLKTETRALAISVISLFISLASLGFGAYTWSIANNYRPSVEIRDTTPLFLNENCYSVSSATKNCALSGDFSVSLGVTSPHPGTYNFSIVSFSPTNSFMYSLSNATLLGKNLTLIDFYVGNGSYQIKVKNETSGHFIYYVGIGGQPPGEASFETSMAILRNPEGNVPANGFERTVNVTVGAQMVRPSDYRGFSRKTQVGTLSCELTYFDIPTNQRIRSFFVIVVWINPTST